MHIVSDLIALQRSRATILTIGAFDGVHRGHQWLMRQVVERARSLDYDSLVITFEPVPQVVLRPGSVQLTDGVEKERIISAIGPTTLAMLPFSHELSLVPAGEFLATILDHVNLAEIWVGADFAFGHNREGDVDLLIRTGQQAGTSHAGYFSVHVVPRLPLNGVALSSSRVRAAVRQGNLEEAATLLGHYVSVRGPVVTGFGRGKELGFPTANVQTPKHQLLPPTGVYAAYLRTDGRRLPAAVSVGYNVVFGGDKISIEAYVLDFSGDLRDKVVALDFVSRIRDEEHFDSVDGLVAKMRTDVDQIRHILDSAQEPGELIIPY